MHWNTVVSIRPSLKKRNTKIATSNFICRTFIWSQYNFSIWFIPKLCDLHLYQSKEELLLIATQKFIFLMRSRTFFFYVRYNLVLILYSLIIQKWQIMNFICNTFRQYRKGSKWQLKFPCSAPQTHKARGGIQAARSHTLSKGTLKSSPTFPGRQCRQDSDVFMNLHYKASSKIYTGIHGDTYVLLGMPVFSLSW